MATYKIAVLPGDGIGQEVTPQAQRVLQVVAKATGIGFEFETALVGGSAIDATGRPLPPASLALCQSAHAILFGSQQWLLLELVAMLLAPRLLNHLLLHLSLTRTMI